MNLDSKIFDRIRIRPNEKRRESERFPRCDWEGCDQPGTHRAPMGRDREGQYLHFCLDHVRLYNKSYNYFAGMSDEAVAAYQKDAATGHRPTWNVGVNAFTAGPGAPEAAAARMSARGRRSGAGTSGPGWTAETHDPFDLFGVRRPTAAPRPETRRALTAMETRAFELFDLEPDAGRERIKARYKELVKRHHPDANGGDRSSEEHLRHVIQAYGVLKNGGFC
ncbi:J domain-containing protein [Pseudoxanthobacter soli]|nr:J domain-containing protein [Pseudoxanthobacter soli]